MDSALVDKHLENLQRQERFLDNKIIKHCKQHMEETIRGSTLFYFARNQFFNELPPKTQEKIVKVVLVNELEVFSYFFEDFVGVRRVPRIFMKNVLTNLTSSVFKQGDVIIKFGEKVKELIVISSGKCELYKPDEKVNGEQKISNLKILLARLPERSWFGDYQIMLELECMLQLEAGKPNRLNLKCPNYVHVYKLEA